MLDKKAAIEKLAKLAKENPGMRVQIVPLLKKLAMEFPTQESLDKYLKDHPTADRKNHTVKKNRPDIQKTHRPVTKKDLKSLKKGQEITFVTGVGPKDGTIKDISKDGIVTVESSDGYRYEYGDVADKKSTVRDLDKLMIKKSEPQQKLSPAEKLRQSLIKDKKKTDKGNKPSKKTYNSKVKSVMDKHNLKDTDAEEIKAFEKNKPSSGKKLSPSQLMQQFLSKAKPETKERMKGVSPADFMKMLGAIMDEET
jgi:hypothetical protein